MNERILFLDDMAERHKTFRPLAVGHPFIETYDAKTAIEALRRLTFGQVFLDHDLCEEDILVDPNGPSLKPTGMAVVEHIMSMVDPPREIVIHSCNEPAARRMEERLRQHPDIESVRRIPFPMLIQLMRLAQSQEGR